MTKTEKEVQYLINGFKVILMDEDTDCGHEVLCTCIAIKHAKIALQTARKELQIINTFEYKRFIQERINRIDFQLEYLETI